MMKIFVPEEHCSPTFLKFWFPVKTFIILHIDVVQIWLEDPNNVFVIQNPIPLWMISQVFFHILLMSFFEKGKDVFCFLVQRIFFFRDILVGSMLIFVDDFPLSYDHLRGTLDSL